MNNHETPEPDPDHSKSAISSGTGIAALIVIAAVAGLILYSIDRYTEQRIADNQAAYALQTLSEVLPATGYDNQPHLDVYMATDQPLLGSAKPLPVYRARLGSATVAVVLTVLAQDGYVAPIRLLIAINTQGEIIGLRALQHQETPGLGDRIDADKSDWLQQFTGIVARSGPAATESTRLRRDGGELDHISGATITSRAVSNAVNHALLYFDEHRDRLLAMEPASQPAESP